MIQNGNHWYQHRQAKQRSISLILWVNNQVAGEFGLSVLMGMRVKKVHGGDLNTQNKSYRIVHAKI